MIYYVVVLYKNDQELPYKFASRHDANEYIFHHKLHAYISAHSPEELKEAEHGISQME